MFWGHSSQFDLEMFSHLGSRTLAHPFPRNLEIKKSFCVATYILLWPKIYSYKVLTEDENPTSQDVASYLYYWRFVKYKKRVKYLSILYEINPFVPNPPFLYPLKTSLETNGLMCDNRFIINTHSLSNLPEKKKLCITNKHISKQPGFQNTRYLLTMKYISTSMESLKHLLISRNDSIYQ